jgi:hypothetical protein
MVGFPGGGHRRRIERSEGDLRAMASLDARAAGAGGETAAVARYLADMTAQLESMAGAARLDLLAYFLAMARLEAEQQARTPSDHDDARAP